MDIKELCVGDHVRYQPRHGGKSEKGIIKEIRDNGIWVVYHCDGSWGDYQNYTGSMVLRRVHVTHIMKLLVKSGEKPVSR